MLKKASGNECQCHHICLFDIYPVLGVQHLQRSNGIVAAHVNESTHALEQEKLMKDRDDYANELATTSAQVNRVRQHTPELARVMPVSRSLSLCPLAIVRTVAHHTYS